MKRATTTAQASAHGADTDADLNGFLLRYRMRHGLASTDVTTWPPAHQAKCLELARSGIGCAPAARQLERAIAGRAADRTGLAAAVAYDEAVIDAAIETGLIETARKDDVARPSWSSRGAGPGRGAALLSLPFDQVRENPRNARKGYEVNALNELAASIRERGIVEPLVVTRGPLGRDGKPGYYVIVAGHRRRRAAELAGLKELPCVVRDRDDDSALAALVENLQREDLSPIDESEAYNRTMKEQGISAAELAKAIGKGVRYVQQRAAIATALIEPARKALAAGAITASHADELARLPAGYQKRVWSYCSNRCAGEPVMSVKRLREHLARNARKLHGAPWKLDEIFKVPGVVAMQACATCPHNSGGQQASCQNPPCYEARLVEVLRRKAAAIKMAGQRVCLVADEYHHPSELKALPKGDMLSKFGYESAQPFNKGAVEVLNIDTGRTQWLKKRGGSGSGADSAWRRKQRAEAEKAKKAKAAAEVRLAELLPRVKAPLPRALRLEVLWLNVDRMWSDVKRPVLKRHGWDKFKNDWSGAKVRAEIEKLSDDQLAQLEIEVVWAYVSQQGDIQCGRHKGKAKSLPALIEEAYPNGG